MNEFKDFIKSLNLSYDEQMMIRISEVLYYQWDPIGVVPFFSARDEYDSYVQLIFKQLKTTDDPKIIADILDKIIVERMELKSDFDKCMFVAKILLDWKHLIYQQK